MIVRGATLLDMPGILEIYNDIIINSTAVYTSEKVSLSNRHDWFSLRTSQGYPILVAEQDGRVLGFASFGEWRGSWSGFKFTVEHSVHVHKDSRGIGIGTRLLTELINIAKEKNVHVMVGSIDAGNYNSISVHKKLGFEEVAYFKEVGTKFDRWLDLVVVQKILEC